MKKAPVIFIFFLLLVQQATAQEKSARDSLLDQLGLMRSKFQAAFQTDAQRIDSLSRRIVFLEHAMDSLNAVLHPAVKVKKGKNDPNIANLVVSTLGKDPAVFIKGAENLTAYVIETNRSDPPLIDGAEYIEGYRILNKIAPVRAADARELRKILLDEKSYDAGASLSKCLFAPYLAYEFADRSHTLILLICLTCNQFEVWDGGKMAASGSIRKVRPKLIALARKIFPEDTVLQTLN